MNIEIHVWRLLFGLAIVAGALELPALIYLPIMVVYIAGVMGYRRWKTK